MIMDFRLPPPDFNEPTNTSYPILETYNQYGTNHDYGNFSGISPAVQSIPQPPPAPQQVQWSQFQSGTQVTQNDQVKREALATEMQNHRAQLSQQREGFLTKINTLKKELETLKKQKLSLRGDSRRSSSPDTHRFLKENAKLQSEIEKKMNKIYDVVEMLDNIIGENPKEDKSKKRKKKRSSSNSADSSWESDGEKSSRHKKHKSRSKSLNRDKKHNLVFYDPGMHWCTLCNVFPKQAKDYLNHLHTPQHFKAASEDVEAPWHDNQGENEGMPSYPGAPSKRTPIKGLQFFIPASAWFCKLCEKWIGDLHCASSHLKSKLHVENYAKFVESNPSWETDWISDRSKNYEKVYRDSVKDSDNQEAPKTEKGYSPHTIAFEDGHPVKIKKQSNAVIEENTIPLKIHAKKDKKKKEKKKSKKKRRSSSVSSDSSDSSSNSELESKSKKETVSAPDTNGQQKSWKEEEPLVDDSVLNQWMSVQENPLGDQDQKIMEKLKNSVKNKVVEKADTQVDERVVSREREARELLTMRAEALKTLRKYNSKEKEDKDRYEKRNRDRSRERERDRDRNRDRDRERDRDRRDRRDRDGDRRYFSSKDQDTKSSRRDRSKSKSQDRDSRSDKHSEKSRNKESKSSNSNTGDSKKMPIIGKMPLYKSMNSKSKQESDQSRDEDSELSKRQQEEFNASIRKALPGIRATLNTHHNAKFPPPGLAFPMPYGGIGPDIHNMLHTLNNASFPQTIHRVQKSPVKVSAPVSAPLVIPPLAAPVIQTSVPSSAIKNATKATGVKDPLHKDFQEALDIIFPGAEARGKETSKPLPKAKEKKAIIEAPKEDTTTVPMSDVDMTQYNQSYQAMQPMAGSDMASQGYDYGMMMPGMMMSGYEYYGYDMSQQQMMAGYEHQQVPEEESAPLQDGKSDMDDLAMLGIDAEDVGAGGF